MRLIKTLAAGSIAALVMAVGGAAAAHADDGQDRVGAYRSYLQQSAESTAASTLAQFDALTAAQQTDFVNILLDPTFVSEELTMDPTATGTTESKAFPGKVSYKASNKIENTTQPLPPNKNGLSTNAAYPGNSTQTGRWTANAVLFGINVTSLQVWVTFTTDKNGLPSKALSSGSASHNLNFLVNVSSTNHAPYIQTPAKLAVATTTWHGCALWKGLGACFDKVQQAKWFQGGLYSATIYNV